MAGIDPPFLFCEWPYKYILQDPKYKSPEHIVPRGGKKCFFLFFKTSINTDFRKVNRFFLFFLNIAMSLSGVILNSFKYCFSWGNWSSYGNLHQFWSFILNKIQWYNITTSSTIPHFEDKSLYFLVFNFIPSKNYLLLRIFGNV